MMTAYSVTAKRSGQWWAVLADVANASVRTQSRRLAHVEDTAREAIALALDIPEDSFDITVNVELPEGVGECVDAARGLTDLADELQTLALQLRRRVATQLQESGFSVRDSGDLIGVSPQRISQLVAEDRFIVDSVTPSADIIVSLDEKLHAARDLLQHVNQIKAFA